MTAHLIEVAHHGRSVHGKVRAPETPGRHPLIIFSHGYNGCMEDFGRSAEFFTAQGFVTVTITFCGGSSVDPGSFPSTSMSLLTEREDLAAVVGEAGSWENVDPEKIFLFGGSQGGIVSALTAAELKSKIRGLIMLYPALCIEDNWTERYPDGEEIPDEIDFWGLTLGKAYALAARGLNTYDKIKAYTGPVLILHGTEDAIVPYSYSVRAKEVYEDARLILFEGERHGFSEENNRRVDGAACCFINEVLS